MIDTKALRSRVLDLAIQGKLTEQLESDGTAEELWQQIQAEKQRLIKEGKIKKERFNPVIYKDEYGVFFRHVENGEAVFEEQLDVPKNWIACSIVDISYSIGTKENQIKTNEILDSGLFPVISQGAKPIDGYCNNKEKVISDVPVLLFGDHTRNVKLIREPFVVGADGTKLHKVLLADEMFIYYWMHHTAEIIASKGYARHYDLLKKACLLLPPLAEQKRIVARVEEIFRLLDIIDAAQEQYEADAESLKAKLITLGIQGRLTEQLESDGTAEELYQQIQAEKQRLIKEGKIKREKPLPEITPDEIPFEIPENWKWVRLGDLLSFIDAGKNIKCIEKPPQSDEVGIVKVSAVSWGVFQENESKTCTEMLNEKYLIQQNDFLISRANTTELVGACVIVEQIEKKLMLSDKILRLNLLSGIYNYYLLHALRSAFLRFQIETVATGTSASMKNISQGEIKELVLPLPPLAEQKRIAETLERVLGVMG